MANKSIPNWIIASNVWKESIEYANRLLEKDLVKFQWTHPTGPKASPAPGGGQTSTGSTAKPLPTPEVAPPTASFNFAAAGFKPVKPSGWSCSVCMVNNKTDAVECVSCASPAPGGGQTSTAPVANLFGIPSFEASSYFSKTT